MNHERIEIRLSKKKGILTFFGSIAFAAGSLWLINIADQQHRYSPEFAKEVGYVGVIFSVLCGLYIFYKLFDTIPRLVIDDDGILDNSSAAAGHMIRWGRIVGLRTAQIRSTRFILIDLADPEDFMKEVSGVKKMLMRGTFNMYGTPASITNTSLDCDFDQLYEMIETRLQSKMKSKA